MMMVITVRVLKGVASNYDNSGCNFENIKLQNNTESHFNRISYRFKFAVLPITIIIMLC